MFILAASFWIATGNRAIRTFAQAAGAILAAGAVGVLDADLLGAASAGALAALISILTSIADHKRIDPIDPASAPRHRAEPGVDPDSDAAADA